MIVRIASIINDGFSEVALMGVIVEIVFVAILVTSEGIRKRLELETIRVTIYMEFNN